jgi:hypothetical protein
MHARLKTPYAKKMKKLGQATVNTVLEPSSTYGHQAHLDKRLTELEQVYAASSHCLQT